jgi:hypothetical protein
MGQSKWLIAKKRKRKKRLELGRYPPSNKYKDE